MLEAGDVGGAIVRFQVSLDSTNGRVGDVWVRSPAHSELCLDRVNKESIRREVQGQVIIVNHMSRGGVQALSCP